LAARASQLDPFKPDIVRWLEAYPLSAAQIFQRLKEAGYPGGYTIVKDYVRRVRPRRAPAFLTLAFAPGKPRKSTGASMARSHSARLGVERIPCIRDSATRVQPSPDARS
jgi:transposase